MIRINLLPVRAARKKESIRLQVTVFFLLVVLVVTAMGGIWFSKTQKIADLNGRIETAQIYLQKYKAAVKEANKIKEELQKLQQKMDVIDQLEADRAGPVRFMDALTSVVVPEKMWLTSLSQGKGQMTLSGVAIDNKTVADFMTNLEKSALFGVVDLISSRQINVDERKYKEFTVTCPLSKGQPDKAEKTP
jgi:type IV pilus assembly protein PilN